MNINIKYFAAMRESAGKEQENWETTSKTAGELFDELSKKYNFSLSKENLKVAVNEEYVSFSELINEGDTIVFIPPVAGG